VPEPAPAPESSTPLKPRTVHAADSTGDDLGRIISLSDGVFAFALTLLALSLVVPSFDSAGLTTAQQSGHLAYLLQHDYNAFIGYAFAFVMIGVWWNVHHRTFRYIARFNGALVWLNMSLLLQIAVMPFVLSVYVAYSDTQTAVALFAAIQVTLGITNTLIWDYCRRAKLLKPDVPENVAHFFSRRGWMTAAVFAISIGVTYLSISAAEACWVVVFFVQRRAAMESS
jgi:uncharacterized membrane protein